MGSSALFSHHTPNISSRLCSQQQLFLFHFPHVLRMPLQIPSCWPRHPTSFSGLFITRSTGLLSNTQLLGFRPYFSDRGIETQLTAYLIQQQHLSRTKPKQLRHQSRKSRLYNYNMAFILPGLRRGFMLSAPFVLSAPLLVHQLSYRQPIHCDSPDPLTKITSDLTGGYSRETQTPVITTSGALSPKAVQQISLGSILGVLAGLGVSVFSKPLAILIGLGIVCVQFLESRGIHLIPYSYLQRRFKQTNIRALVHKNVPLKMSFGITFALAAFAEF